MLSEENRLILDLLNARGSKGLSYWGRLADLVKDGLAECFNDADMPAFRMIRITPAGRTALENADD